ncbi:MAG TPA: molecular chaperone DnaJ [Acidimicrobiales bacterium]|nr:molecular chaperone DnaJ [Acidimicrobiales bacterium]
MADYYELLGVAPSATEDEIKRAYRKLARELHPDANGGDPHAEDRFKEVTVAYETLRDPERRRRYDMFGPDTAAAGAGAGFDAGPFAAGLGDLFESFFGGGFGGSPFGGGRTRARSRQGPDMEVAVDLTFDEAVFGVQREVRLRQPVACATCQGSGARPGTTPTTCGECGGSGEVHRVRRSILGQMVSSSPCGQCGGTGEEVTSPCSDCRGEGRVTEERAYTVDVPAGVDDGSTLRLTGRGAAGARGGGYGDLYVHLRVEQHERFQRHGNDLVDVLHLPITQATLGAHLRYDTLDGTEDLVVPAGTQSGRVFRLRGRGVPHLDGRGRGDLLVQVMVDTPTHLTAEQAELLRRFAAARGDEVAPADTRLFSKIRSAFK